MSMEKREKGNEKTLNGKWRSKEIDSVKSREKDRERR